MTSLDSSTTKEKQTPEEYHGSARLLTGIVLGVLTFWLFASSMGTIAPNVLRDINGKTGIENITASQMNMAISITALFSGLFIVLLGGLADKIGLLKVAITGNILGILGSLLVVLSGGGLALPLMLTGRILQGLSAACVMPSTMALLRVYWKAAERQRAVSMWSIGSWGGSGMSALVGGLLASQLSWRAVFIASIIVSFISIMLMLGAPEHKVDKKDDYRFDYAGLASFMVMTLAFMVIIIFGRQIGWTEPIILILLAVGVVSALAFTFIEKRNTHRPFIDFKLFKNPTFTGATLSNFLTNATIGLLMVSQQMLQMANKGYDPWNASVLTIGYAVTIIGLIRVGEKFLRAYGPRKPMLWGAWIVAISAMCLIPTNLMIEQYSILAIIAYSLFGVGLALYATPSTDAALSNLPADQMGAGSGIYKMASSLGSAIGAAVSLTIFSAFSSTGSAWIGKILPPQGSTENIAVRQAGTIVFLINLLIILIAITAITLTVPKGRKYNDD